MKTLSPETRRRIHVHITALASPEGDTSFQAERRLIRFGPKAVDALLAASVSDNPQVRFRAVWALGKIGDCCAFPRILEMTEDPDEVVAYDAALALGELGDPRALPPLAARVRRAADSDVVAYAAVVALRKFGPAAVPWLEEITTDGTPCGREIAASALEMLHNDRTPPVPAGARGVVR